jgi:hypothetical protein
MCMTVREKGEGRGKVSGGELSHKACQVKAPDRCTCHSTAFPYLASRSTFPKDPSVFRAVFTAGVGTAV